MIITGIDPSLACTGIATIWTDAPLIETFRARTEKCESGLMPMRRRIRTALARILREIPAGTSVVVIEEPSKRSQFGSHNERVGLYWFLVDQLLGKGIEVVPVSPKGRAKYAVGNGNADKRTVLAAVRAGFPGASVPDDNVADALALAAMGARAWGRPVDGAITVKQQEAFDAVSWPTNRE